MLKHQASGVFAGTCQPVEKMPDAADFFSSGSAAPQQRRSFIRHPFVTGLQRLRFAAGLAAGLAYLHARGFIHPDVASRNVLLALTAKIQPPTRPRRPQGENYRNAGSNACALDST